MKTIILGGSHPRHLHYLNAVASHPAVDLVAAAIQKRETMLPRPPDNIDPHDRELFVRHFSYRDAKEAQYFGAPEAEFEARRIDHGELNAYHLRAWLYDVCPDPDLVIVFGCGMIGDKLMDQLGDRTINLHLGLSPRYRGAATLFWPQYFLEPQWAGTTFHQIVHEPDAGPILHQSQPGLFKGDTLHDVSCRAVRQATADMLTLLDTFDGWTFRAQRNTGKCFLERDFQPAHLRMIYDVWDDRIVDAYMDGVIGGREPKLYRANVSAKEKVKA